MDGGNATMLISFLILIFVSDFDFIYFDVSAVATSKNVLICRKYYFEYWG